MEIDNELRNAADDLFYLRSLDVVYFILKNSFSLKKNILTNKRKLLFFAILNTQ